MSISFTLDSQVMCVNEDDLRDRGSVYGLNSTMCGRSHKSSLRKTYRGCIASTLSVVVGSHKPSTECPKPITVVAHRVFAAYKDFAPEEVNLPSE